MGLEGGGKRATPGHPAGCMIDGGRLLMPLKAAPRYSSQTRQGISDHPQPSASPAPKFILPLGSEENQIQDRIGFVL